MAIESVLLGKTYLSPGISERVIEGYLKGRKTIKSESSWDTLTKREREVLKWIGEGYKNKEIANYLLNLHSASALTALAIERGLVTK